VLAAAIPILFLHVSYQPGVAVGFGSTTINAYLSDFAVLAVVVVAAASSFGHKLEDSFRVPGLDSQKANDLVTAAGTGQARLTARRLVGGAGRVGEDIQNESSFCGASLARRQCERP